MHSWYDKTLIFRRVRVIWIKLIIWNCSPRHAPGSSAVDNARMNFAECVADMVMEPCRDVDSSCPELDVANILEGIGGQLDMEPDQVIEFKTLLKRCQQREQAVYLSKQGLTLKRPLAQGRSSTLTQGNFKFLTSEGNLGGKIL